MWNWTRTEVLSLLAFYGLPCIYVPLNENEKVKQLTSACPWSTAEKLETQSHSLSQTFQAAKTALRDQCLESKMIQLWSRGNGSTNEPSCSLCGKWGLTRHQSQATEQSLHGLFVDLSSQFWKIFIEEWAKTEEPGSWGPPADGKVKCHVDCQENLHDFHWKPVCQTEEPFWNVDSFYFKENLASLEYLNQFSKSWEKISWRAGFCSTAPAPALSCTQVCSDRILWCAWQGWMEPSSVIKAFRIFI